MWRVLAQYLFGPSEALSECLKRSVWAPSTHGCVLGERLRVGRWGRAKGDCGCGRVGMAKLGEDDGVRDKTRKLHKNQRVETLRFYSAGDRAHHVFDLAIRKCPQVMEEMTRPCGCRLKYLLSVYLEQQIVPSLKLYPYPILLFVLKTVLPPYPPTPRPPCLET